MNTFPVITLSNYSLLFISNCLSLPLNARHPKVDDSVPCRWRDPQYKHLSTSWLFVLNMAPTSMSSPDQQTNRSTNPDQRGSEIKRPSYFCGFFCHGAFWSILVLDFVYNKQEIRHLDSFGDWMWIFYPGGKGLFRWSPFAFWNTPHFHSIR